MGYMLAPNYFFGLTDDKNEWQYVELDGSGEISQTDPSDIQITCVIINNNYC